MILPFLGLGFPEEKLGILSSAYTVLGIYKALKYLLNEKSIFILNTPSDRSKPTCWGDFSPVNTITRYQREDRGGDGKNKWDRSQTCKPPPPRPQSTNQPLCGYETLGNSRSGYPLKWGWLRHVHSLHTAAAEFTDAEKHRARGKDRESGLDLTISWQPAQQMEPSLRVLSFLPLPRRSAPAPDHSPPLRSVLFRGLRYKVDFLFRSFIFSWERFCRPRKKSWPSPPSCSILHLFRCLLRIPWHLELTRVALPLTKFGHGSSRRLWAQR